MNKDYIFYLVYDASKKIIVGQYPTIMEAHDRANMYCKENLGTLVTVMNIQKAFRAKATVDEEYLYHVPVQKIDPAPVAEIEPAFASPEPGPVEYEL